jgi:RNA polymerase sigma-70 factor (ECF subfamily)
LAQVQPAPQRHTSPHSHPERRLVESLAAMIVSLSPADPMSAFIDITHQPVVHYSERFDRTRGIQNTGGMSEAVPLPNADPAPLAILLENHRAFLSYLERRIGDRALAEDILQEAFARVVERPDRAPADEGVVSWFYRTLRNAAIDQFRRRGAASRALETFAHELESQAIPDADLEGEICACVTRLAGTLKPEYAEALRAIDVDGTPVKKFAEQHGLSASNAGVRVFRARDALKRRVMESCGTCAEHGCRDCTCRG